MTCSKKLSSINSSFLYVSKFTHKDKEKERQLKLIWNQICLQSINMARQKVDKGDFRHAEFNSGLYFELSLIIQGALTSFFVRSHDRFFGVKLGIQIFKSIRPCPSLPNYLALTINNDIITIIIGKWALHYSPQGRSCYIAPLMYVAWKFSELFDLIGAKLKDQKMLEKLLGSISICRQGKGLIMHLLPSIVSTEICAILSTNVKVSFHIRLSSPAPRHDDVINQPNRAWVLPHHI